MGVTIRTGDCREVLRTLESESVNCIVTSPPYYGLRDYGMADQLGLEETPDAYVAEMAAVFREARRVLRDDGTLWLNIGDSYASPTKGSGGTGKSGLMNDGREEIQRNKTADASNGRAKFDVRRFDLAASGLKPKDLIGVPWMLAFALRADGWYLRQDIIWHKPNPMPESVEDRCTKSHEYIFLLSKSPRYFWDAEVIAEPAVIAGDWNNATEQNSAYAMHTLHQVGEKRNKRDVWTVATHSFPGAHFATMAPDLARTCIMAGCPLGGTVLDPFGGAGTTGLVADQLQRNALLIELNPDYVELARKRIDADAGMFATEAA